MCHFLKKEVIEKSDTFQKSSSIDPADKKNQKHARHVNLGYAAQATLKKLAEKMLQVSCAFYLLKMIALSFCQLLQ